MLGSSHLCAESAHEYVCVPVHEQTSHLTRLHVKVKIPNIQADSLEGTVQLTVVSHGCR